MTAFDPNEPPFWEKERGGGPVSEWKAGFDKALDAQQEKKLRLLDPRGVRAEEERMARGVCIQCEAPSPGNERCEKCRAVRKNRQPALTYAQRRKLGLCQTCESPSPDFARCAKCRHEYNNRPSRQREYRGPRGE